MDIEHVGRRHYLVGLGYDQRGIAKGHGAKFDFDRKMWWTGKADRAAAIVDECKSAVANGGQRTERKADGLDTIVAGRAKYKGRSYYVVGRVIRGRTQWDDEVAAVMTRDETKMLLAFCDGSKTFWAARDAVEVAKYYQRPTTITGLRNYAEQRKQEDAGERECPVCERHCTCGTSFCHHHHDGCDRCGEES